MAGPHDWDAILSQKFKVFQVEESTYVESSQRSNGPDMFAKFICDSLRDCDVPQNLRLMYREAVYGSNEAVKKRIRSGMYFIGKHCRYSIYFP